MHISQRLLEKAQIRKERRVKELEALGACDGRLRVALSSTVLQKFQLIESPDALPRLQSGVKRASVIHSRKHHPRTGERRLRQHPAQEVCNVRSRDISHLVPKPVAELSEDPIPAGRLVPQNGDDGLLPIAQDALAACFVLAQDHFHLLAVEHTDGVQRSPWHAQLPKIRTHRGLVHFLGADACDEHRKTCVPVLHAEPQRFLSLPLQKRFLNQADAFRGRRCQHLRCLQLLVGALCFC
mmetsp:Transcript_9929/g.37450  ORF Transcript_9929/g.37450 Transcript_9929/m.37450 type:complete len:239 (+) Transcript_9929:1321-2037(+)